MSSSLSRIYRKFIVALRSQKGRDAMMFMAFVVISAILWGVLSLNEEEQYDVRMPLRITHVPDSITLISKGPEALSVSLNAKGTQLIKMSIGDMPTVNVDFRAFRSGNAMRLSSADLKGLVRNATGGSQVNLVSPDSLVIPFTTHAGFRMLIEPDYKVMAGPQAALVGRPRLSADSALVFTADNVIPDNVHTVTTEPVRLTDIEETVTRRVRLIGPKGSRVIPDSIDITFEVEPLIFKSRKVVIEPVNVPDDIKLITFPAQIDVFYMVPLSEYKSGESHFRVVADYRTIKRNESTNVKLQLLNVPPKYQNVYLSADSAEYIIERH
ncbi:MAG: hypothetical protein HDS65_04235 [Bacteroidales bacterium]|nr:hypothetical protein [Bacteroidales bacterium]